MYVLSLFKINSKKICDSRVHNKSNKMCDATNKTFPQYFLVVSLLIIPHNDLTNVMRVILN
jgi:hypothetical protein